VPGFLLAAALALASFAFARQPQPDSDASSVTWSSHIAPIVQRHCIRCHAAGGFAPFPLATYDAALSRADAIKAAVASGDMPPWDSADEVGHFSNDRRLTAREIELLTSWVDGGAPQGDPTLVEAPAPADGLVMPLGNEVVTEASERDARVTLQLQPGYTLTRWTFEPGAPAIVESAELELDSRWLGTWTPGDVAIDFPGHAGVPLPESSRFTVSIAYREPAGQMADSSRLRLWIARAPEPKPVRATTVIKTWRTTGRAEVFAVRPADEDGAVRVVARFADGRVAPIGTFDPASTLAHPTYRLVTPLMLPAGTRVESTGPVRVLYVEDASPRKTATPVRRR
jgi:mono/diheme cytochrome c family protein